SPGSRTGCSGQAGTQAGRARGMGARRACLPVGPGPVAGAVPHGGRGSRLPRTWGGRDARAPSGRQEPRRPARDDRLARRGACGATRRLLDWEPGSAREEAEMKRFNIQSAFVGEPTASQEGLEADDDQEAVVLRVRGGELTLVVPSGTPDEQIVQRCGVLRGALRLENERVLTFE